MALNEHAIIIYFAHPLGGVAGSGWGWGKEVEVGLGRGRLKRSLIDLDICLGFTELVEMMLT